MDAPRLFPTPIQFRDRLVGLRLVSVPSASDGFGHISGGYGPGRCSSPHLLRKVVSSGIASLCGKVIQLSVECGAIGVFFTNNQ